MFIGTGLHLCADRCKKLQYGGVSGGTSIFFPVKILDDSIEDPKHECNYSRKLIHLKILLQLNVMLQMRANDLHPADYPHTVSVFAISRWIQFSIRMGDSNRNAFSRRFPHLSVRVTIMSPDPLERSGEERILNEDFPTSSGRAYEMSRCYRTLRSNAALRRIGPILLKFGHTLFNTYVGLFSCIKNLGHDG